MTTSRYLVLATVLSIGSGCRTIDATEVVVTIDTTLGVPCDIDRIEVSVTGSMTMTETVALAGIEFPASLGLVPAAGVTEAMVEVTALKGSQTVASARSMARFVDGSSQELRFVLGNNCTTAECTGQSLPFSGLASAQTKPSCADRAYAVATSPVSIRDACILDEPVKGTVLLGTDEAEARSPLAPGLPFPVFFYGKDVSNLWVGSNGYIAFSDAVPSNLASQGHLPTELSQAVFDEPGIVPFWDDLFTGSAGVCMAVEGSAPNRTLWVTWKSSCFSNALPCGPTTQGQLTFSVGIEEAAAQTPNRIYFGYPAMSADGVNEVRSRGSQAVIGLKGGGRGACPPAQCSTDGLCSGTGEPCGYTQFSAFTASSGPLPTLEFKVVK